jgi:hypothetical protein
LKQTIEQAALDYLRLHWSVIPMRARDKRPAIRWQEYQHRRASEAEVRIWFQEWPDSNVGIVTGVLSGLVVLDIDPRHGGDNSLALFLREHGPLPQTIESRTGGGGWHVYFAHPGGIVRNKVGLAPGIDVRGDGGCVVAPPSVHGSGRPYVWLEGHAPRDNSVAPMPGWLLREVTDRTVYPVHRLENWRDLIREGVPEGTRNNTIASLTGHLLWHGVDPDVVQELLLCWNRVRCQPPLSDEEVLRTVDSITRIHERQQE